MILRTIVFKPDADLGAITRLRDRLSDLGKLRDDTDFPKQIIASFDDAMDFLAFLCAIGAATYTTKAAS